MPNVPEIDETTALRARVERLEDEMKAIRRAFYHALGTACFVVFALLNPLILIQYGLGAGWLVVLLTVITIVAGYDLERTINQRDI